MSDTKLLQKIIDKVSVLEQKMDRGFKGVAKQFEGTNKRIDKLGLQLARLEDDAPTIAEFDNLEKRVSKIEHQITKN